MYHVIPRIRNANFYNKYGFWEPSITFGRFKLETSLFGRHIYHNKYLPSDDKLTPKVGVVRSRDLNLKFGTPP